MAEYTPLLDTVNALISLEMAKALIGAKITDDAQEVALIFYINAASHYCNTYTGRSLLSRANTEYYNGNGDDKLILNNYPVSTLTSVYDDQAQTFAVGSLIPATSLYIIPDGLKNIIAYYGGAFTPGYHNIKVVYTAGYATVPYDLQEACFGIVALYFYQTQEKRFGITSRSVGDGSTTFDKDVPRWITSILDGYKKKW